MYFFLFLLPVPQCLRTGIASVLVVPKRPRVRIKTAATVPIGARGISDCFVVVVVVVGSEPVSFPGGNYSLLAIDRLAVAPLLPSRSEARPHHEPTSRPASTKTNHSNQPITATHHNFFSLSRSESRKRRFPLAIVCLCVCVRACSFRAARSPCNRNDPGFPSPRPRSPRGRGIPGRGRFAS